LGAQARSRISHHSVFNVQHSVNHIHAGGTTHMKLIGWQDKKASDGRLVRLPVGAKTATALHDQPHRPNIMKVTWQATDAHAGTDKLKLFARADLPL
jgi:hypothetical protein